MERERTRGGHRKSASSGDADGGEGVNEGAEVDSALPRRRRLARDRGLLLGLGRVGLRELDASLGLLLVLDLERAELVAPSKDAVVLQKGEGGLGGTHDAEGGRPGGAGIDSRAEAWSRALKLVVVQVSRPVRAQG